MTTTPSAPFRLTVLNPGGRDPEQHFPEGAGTPGTGHQPTNFHAYAACTRGSFHREVERAIAEETPVLVLLRGDFRAAENALQKLRAAGRIVAVSLKETGRHQIAEQLRDPRKLTRCLQLVRGADACLAATPEAAEFYASIRGGSERVAFIPTPYPLAEPAWNFAQPMAARAGIFIGTREFSVPSRNHLAALLAARVLSEKTGAGVTVYNFERRVGRQLVEVCDFAPGKLRVLDRQLAYPDYLRGIAAHRIVLQLDTSFVPGQVAGDAALCRVPCVGGNGAIDRLAFPALSSFGRPADEITRVAERLLTDDQFYAEQIAAIDGNAASRIGFAPVAGALREFFRGLGSR